MVKRPGWKWEYLPMADVSMIKIGSNITVKPGHHMAGKVLKVTRVDSHAYPICAGYTRFKLDQITVNEEN